MKDEVANLIREALTDVIEHLILRGTDPLAAAGGDIDVLVTRSQTRRAAMRILDCAPSLGWHVIRLKSLRYVDSIVVSRVNDSGVAYSTKIDLIDGIEWYGVGTGLTSSKFFGLVRNAHGDHSLLAKLAAFITFTQKLLASGQLSARDWERIKSSGTTRLDLLSMAHSIDIPLYEDDVTRAKLSNRRKWALRFRSSGFCGMRGFSLWSSSVARSALLHRLGFGCPFGLQVSIAGMDGSGKSTQIQLLTEQLTRADSDPPIQVHLLPRWIPMPHQLLRRRSTTSNYLRPYAEAPVKSQLSGVIRLSYYLAAFLVAKMWTSSAVSRGRMIIQDRSFIDFAADLSRARIPHRTMYEWVIKACSPIGVKIFLDVSPEAAVSRKGELTNEKAESLRERYLHIISRTGAVLIDADCSAGVVLRSIQAVIHAEWRRQLAPHAHTDLAA
jgi:thymidylate kinase